MELLVLCDDGDIADVLSVARTNGFGIEIRSFFWGTLGNVGEVLSTYLGLLEGFGGFRSMHGPFVDLCPGSADPLVRHVAAYRFNQAINVANKLDVRHLI